MDVEPIREKENIDKIKKILMKQSYRDYFMFVLGINSGLTPVKLINLKVKDVKSANFIYMNKNIKFPIINELKVEISKYIENMSEEDYLFPSKKVLDKPINSDRVYIIMKNVGREIGLNHLGSHSLRKTFGYHYYSRTGDIDFLVKVFNQSSRKFTLNYIGVNPVDCIRENLKKGFL